MVELIAQHDAAATYVTYLPELQAEYNWWMQGEKNVRPGHANRRVVKLADGTALNRYWLWPSAWQNPMVLAPPAVG